MVPGTRLYPLVPPLPVLSSLKPDHLLSAVASAYALRADGGRADTAATSGSTLYFRVDDIGAARAELVDRGVPFEDAPHLIAPMLDHELWMTFFRDPDRNLHGLMAEVR